MAKTINYFIMREDGLFLQGTKPNERYCNNAKAPTMGNAHVYSEYETEWGAEPVLFEPLTLASYIKVILEEFRWETRKPAKFSVFSDAEFGTTSTKEKT